MNYDRTVHGRTTDGYEIARYDRSGKWYLEPIGGGKRQAITVSEAAKRANAGEHTPRVPGGMRLDSIVAKLVAADAKVGAAKVAALTGDDA